MKEGYAHMDESLGLLESYRRKLVWWIGGAIMILVVPFTLNNLLQGRLFVGAASLSVVVLMLITATILYTTGKPHPELLFPPIAAFLVLCFFKQGVIAAFWSYPAVVVFYFLLPFRKAVWVNVALFLVLAPVSFHILSVDLAARFAATILGVSLTSAIFLGQLENQSSELRRMAVTDPLTQTLNRLQMDHILSSCRARARRAETTFSLISLDIDHFKAINDDFGHAEGDRVLKGVAKIMKDRIRTSDYIFRTGGEEFLLLLEQTNEYESVMVAEELRRLVEESGLCPERKVTISLGVACWRAGELVESCVKRSDERLYLAKRRGRNRVVAQTDSQVLQRSALSSLAV